MRTYIRIACRYIRKYPQRSLAMALSVVLSVFLIVAIGSLNESSKNSQVMHSKNQGAQHVIYHGINAEQLEKARAYRNAERVAALVYFDQWNTPDGLAVSLLAADSNNLYMENTRIKEGSLPTQPDEIALEGWVLDQLGLPHKVGETLQIDLVEKGEKRGYTLTGIIEDRMEEKATGQLDAFIALNEGILSEKDGQISALVEFKQGVGINEEIDKLAAAMGLQGDGSENIEPNEILLSAMGQTGELDRELVLLSLMLMLVAGMVIFSVYSISALKRIRDYGMMRAIGATSRQIIYIILAEIAVIYVGGAALGLAGAAVFVQLFKGAATDVFIFHALEGFGNLPLDIIVISLPAVKLALLIALAAVLAAGMRVARMAALLSPLEAVNRSTQDEKIRFADRQGRLDGLLDVTKRVTVKNLRRNKKAVVFTLIAMSIGCTLFMVRSFTLEMFGREQNLFYADKNPRENDELRLNVNNTAPMTLGYTGEQIAEYNELPAVNEVFAAQLLYSRLKIAESQLNGDFGNLYVKKMDERLTEFDKKPGEASSKPEDRMGFSFPGDSGDELVIRNTVMGLSKPQWDSLSRDLSLKENTSAENASRPQAVLYVPKVNKEGTFWGEGYTRMEPVLKIKAGDVVRVTYPRQGYEKSLDNWDLIHQYNKYREQYADLEFTVAAITETLPEQDEFWLGTDDAPYIIIPDQVFQEVTGIDTYRIMSIDLQDAYSEADYKTLKEKVKQTAALIPGTTVQDRAALLRDQEKAEREYILFYAAVALVLITIGGLSIYNNINYNIISRLREHGILKALGLTNGQFKGMLRFEGVLYGAISVLFSCILALLIELGIFVYNAYFSYYTLSNKHFFLEWKSFLLVILVNIGIGYLASVGPAAQVNKLEITEAIRSVE